MITDMPRRDQPPANRSERLAAVPTGIRLTPAHYDVVRLLAESRGVSISTVVRDAIERLARDFVDDAEGRTMWEAAELGHLEDFELREQP